VYARVWLLLTDDQRHTLRGLFARCHAPCRTCGALAFTNFDGLFDYEMDFMNEVLSRGLRRDAFPDYPEMPCNICGYDPTAKECPPAPERPWRIGLARLSPEELGAVAGVFGRLDPQRRCPVCGGPAPVPPLTRTEKNALRKLFRLTPRSSDSAGTELGAQP
jgi:hypothetical protein